MWKLIPAETAYQIADYVSLVVSFHNKGKTETRLNWWCNIAMMLRRHYPSQDQKK